MFIPIMQTIRAKTKLGKFFEIHIIEENKKFSVELTEFAIAAGTFFNTAEQALNASLKAASEFYGDEIVSLESRLVEEFITNQRMAELLS